MVLKLVVWMDWKKVDWMGSELGEPKADWWEIYLVVKWDENLVVSWAENLVDS